MDGESAALAVHAATTGALADPTQDLELTWQFTRFGPAFLLSWESGTWAAVYLQIVAGTLLALGGLAAFLFWAQSSEDPAPYLLTLAMVLLGAWNGVRGLARFRAREVTSKTPLGLPADAANELGAVGNEERRQPGRAGNDVADRQVEGLPVDPSSDSARFGNKQ